MHSISIISIISAICIAVFVGYSRLFTFTHPHCSSLGTEVICGNGCALLAQFDLCSTSMASYATASLSHTVCHMQKATPKTRSAQAMASPFFLSCRSSSTALAIGIAPCAGVQNKLNRCDCKRQCCSRATEQQKLLQLTNDLHKLQLVGSGWEGGVLCSICS